MRFNERRTTSRFQRRLTPTYTSTARQIGTHVKLLLVVPLFFLHQGFTLEGTTFAYKLSGPI